MKTLIIDDTKQHAYRVKKYLEEIFSYDEDDKPIIKTNPQNGIMEMNHSYDLVFVDFKFDNHSLTGTDIGLEIRKKYPLATLILITAFGKENILKFIHVGFDAYLDKDEGDLNQGLINFKKTIKIGIENSQKRIKSKFSFEELKNVKDKLDAIETVIKESAYDTIGNIVVYGDLLQKGVPIEELKDKVNHRKINQCLKNKKDYIDSLEKEHKLIGRTSLNTYLKVYHRQTNTFISNENALKVRQLVLENNSISWKKIANLIKPFNGFLKDFDIKLSNK